MRIDGLSTAYLPERTKAPAAISFKDVQREHEVRRELPQPASASQGFELRPLIRHVEAPTTAVQVMNEPMSLVEFKRGDTYLGPLSSLAREALAAYTSTASFTREQDAYQILGLDVYA